MRLLGEGVWMMMMIVKAASLKLEIVYFEEVKT